MDNNKQLASCSTSEICQAITILNSIRNNNTTPEQIITAAEMIKKEYGHITLGDLQQTILNGLMQKYAVNSPQYNDIPSLMFWLIEAKRERMRRNPTIW